MYVLLFLSCNADNICELWHETTHNQGQQLLSFLSLFPWTSFYGLLLLIVFVVNQERLFKIWSQICLTTLPYIGMWIVKKSRSQKKNFGSFHLYFIGLWKLEIYNLRSFEILFVNKISVFIILFKYSIVSEKAENFVQLNNRRRRINKNLWHHAMTFKVRQIHEQTKQQTKPNC